MSPEQEAALEGLTWADVAAPPTVPAALDALGDAILQVDCYDVVEGDEVPRSDFWAVVAAARKVLSAHPIEPPQHGCDAHDRRPCYTCAAHPAEPAPVGHSWSPNGVHYPPLGGAHVVERCQSGCPPQPEPAPVVTDAAKVAGLAALHSDNEWHKSDGAGVWRANYARAVDLILEAAAPLLGPRPLLDREAVTRVIGHVRALPWDEAVTPHVDAVMKLARPMPTQGQINDLLMQHRVLWQRSDSVIACACDPADQDRRLPIQWFTHIEFAAHQRDAVLALLNGAES